MTTGIVLTQEFTRPRWAGHSYNCLMKGCRLPVVGVITLRDVARPQVIRGLAGERLAGQEYTAEQLAALLNQQVSILSDNEGGITFSAVNPPASEFVAEVIDCWMRYIPPGYLGYGSKRSFQKLSNGRIWSSSISKLIDPACIKVHGLQ